MTGGWDNLGYWAVADSYLQACHALARRVGEAAKLHPGHRLVDVGVGWGAQLSVWCDDFGVTSVIGIEADAERADVARSRVSGPASEVVTGEAGALATLVAGSFDVIVSVDAAYFFRQRGRFYSDALACLRPGGCLVFTDLLVEHPGRLARIAGRICGIPSENLRSAKGHLRWLEGAGFSNVHVEPLEPWVLGGFARWAATDPRARRSPRHRVTAALIRWLGRRVSYGLLVAVKPSE